MKAVIIATMDSPGIAPLEERYPPPLLPLVDRPFVQHLVEYLAGQGIREFDFILGRLPGPIDSFLGDGKRWGSAFRYHLAPEPSASYPLLTSIDLGGRDTGVLLGHADRLPFLPLRETLTASASLPLLFSWGRRWTGWALLRGEHLAGLPGDTDENSLKAHLLAAAQHEHPQLEVGRPLRMRSCRDVLAAHRAVLAKEFSGLLLSGHEIEPGFRMARRSTLHSTVRIAPPVYVGENCMIGPEVQLGPHAVLVKDCVLDDRCSVRSSVILPGSYVGTGVRISGAIVDRKHVIDLRQGQVLTAADDFILGSLVPENPFHRITSLFARLVRGRTTASTGVVAKDRTAS